MQDNKGCGCAIFYMVVNGIFSIIVLITRFKMPTFEKLADAGFWLGLWQGIIIQLSFLMSLFDKTITLYQFGNSGGWYNFGFVLGIMLVASLAATVAAQLTQKYMPQ